MDGSMLGFVALVLAAGSLVLWFRGIRNVSVPRNRGGYVAMWLSAALLGVFALVLGAGLFGGIAAGLGLLLGAFFLFTVAISRQEVASNAIQVGVRLPDVSAPDQDGNAFSLTSLVGRPALVKFFRGHW